MLDLAALESQNLKSTSSWHGPLDEPSVSKVLGFWEAPNKTASPWVLLRFLRNYRVQITCLSGWNTLFCKPYFFVSLMLPYLCRKSLSDPSFCPWSLLWGKPPSLWCWWSWRLLLEERLLLQGKIRSLAVLRNRTGTARRSSCTCVPWFFKHWWQSCIRHPSYSSCTKSHLLSLVKAIPM